MILWNPVALRKESVDRNLLGRCRDSGFERSLSARRAWIEIRHPAGGPRPHTVALRKESVDRNRTTLKRPLCCCVALRKESVDRNDSATPEGQRVMESLSARRAWIEIAGQPAHGLPSMSLSARRAWIEIRSVQFPPPSSRCRSPQGERG